MSDFFQKRKAMKVFIEETQGIDFDEDKGLIKNLFKLEEIQPNEEVLTIFSEMDRVTYTVSNGIVSTEMSYNDVYFSLNFPYQIPLMSPVEFSTDPEVANDFKLTIQYKGDDVVRSLGYEGFIRLIYNIVRVDLTSKHINYQKSISHLEDYLMRNRMHLTGEFIDDLVSTLTTKDVIFDFDSLGFYIDRLLITAVNSRYCLLTSKDVAVLYDTYERESGFSNKPLPLSKVRKVVDLISQMSNQLKYLHTDPYTILFKSNQSLDDIKEVKIKDHTKLDYDPTIPNAISEGFCLQSTEAQLKYISEIKETAIRESIIRKVSDILELKLITDDYYIDVVITQRPLRKYHIESICFFTNESHIYFIPKGHRAYSDTFEDSINGLSKDLKQVIDDHIPHDLLTF